MQELLAVPSRRRIYECVQEHPGAHLRDIARRTGLPLGTTLYHLDALESRGALASRRDGRYKRYFSSAGIGRREKDLLSTARHDAPRRILQALLERGASTQRDLCGATGLSRSTLSFHVNVLLERGFVERESARPERLYRVLEPELVRDTLSRYADSLTATPTRTLVPVVPTNAPAPVQPSLPAVG